MLSGVTTTAPRIRVPSRTLAEWDIYLGDSHASGTVETLEAARARVEEYLTKAGEGIRGRICVVLLWPGAGWHPWVRDFATERWATVRDGAIVWRPPWT